MTVKEKTILGPVLLVLSTLLLGLALQLGLAWQREAGLQARGGALVVQAQRLSREELDRRVRAQGEEQERLLALERRIEAAAQKKRSPREQEDPSLLMLVNPWHPLPEDYEPELELVLEQYDRSYEMDRRAAEPLRQMLADCEAAGHHPILCSAYRTQAVQEGLYYNKIGRLLEEGIPWSRAPEIAAQSVAVPGTSEHQLGLAADIIDENYPYLDEGQEQTGTQRWLMENCWRYGFILRYPNGTTDITGIIYEPWHYRYVGGYAKDVTDRGVTFEEYLLLRRGKSGPPLPVELRLCAAGGR